jgi:WD40 repeat protein
VSAQRRVWSAGDRLRRPFSAILAIPLLLMLPVEWPQAGTVRAVNPEMTSARGELEHLQKKYGLTLGFVDYRGRISTLNFKKRAFVALSMEAGPYGGRIAPDGKLAALQERDPLTLAIVRLDGTTLKKYPGVRGFPVCWSYDSSRLMLVTSGFQLQVMDVASGVVQTLPINQVSNTEGFTSQCWSPDGKQMVYPSSDGYVSVYDFETQNSTKLTKGAYPTWTPDGNWIAYRDGDTYYAIHPSGEGRKKLFHKTRAISGLLWSPDSRFVAYIHEDLISFLGYSRVMVRRLADGSEEWVAQGVDAGDQGYQWVQNPSLIQWVESGNQKY